MFGVGNNKAIMIINKINWKYKKKHKRFVYHGSFDSPGMCGQNGSG